MVIQKTKKDIVAIASKFIEQDNQEDLVLTVQIDAYTDEAYVERILSYHARELNYTDTLYNEIARNISKK